MKKIGVGLIGMGTVGSGTAKILIENAEEISLRTGLEIELKKIAVRDKTKPRYDGVQSTIITDDAEEVVNDENIDIVVEVMGGTILAKRYIKAAFRNKKSVVTANKDLLALYIKELFDDSFNRGCHFGYEAAVAGAVPILRAINTSFKSDNISEITGIVNGTTNYILTKMKYDSKDFKTALKEAQDLGYAEADPTSDIEGIDAARKAAVLSSLAFHSPVVLGDVYVEGITNITPEDMYIASKLNHTIKLCANLKEMQDGIESAVYPLLIANDDFIGKVENSFNGIFLHSDYAGECFMYGKGAGELPTASAIVSDIIEIAQKIAYEDKVKRSAVFYKNKKVLKIEDTVNGWLIRAENDISDFLNENGIKNIKLLGTEKIVAVYPIKQSTLFETLNKFNGKITSKIRVKGDLLWNGKAF